jgi:hypothetical protein
METIQEILKKQADERREKAMLATKAILMRDLEQAQQKENEENSEEQPQNLETPPCQDC